MFSKPSFCAAAAPSPDGPGSPRRRVVSSTGFSTGFPRPRVSRQRRVAAALVAVLLLAAADLRAADPPPPGAAQLLERAEAGDPWAQLNLGAAFDNGLAGLPLDPVRAVTWYRRAAAAGLAEAQFNLAHCLVTGNGTARNDAEALTWMLRAAEQGLASAQFLAGVMLVEGIGSAPDRERALPWLQRAAANGNTDAAALLRRLDGDTAD